jgi:hypothetical protein
MTHVLSPKLNNRQRNIIIGTILGGSSVVKPSKGRNCYLSMRSKNIDWLRWKATELRSLATQEPITVEKTNRWHSICYPIFNEFREMFYDGKDRVLTEDALDLLQDLAMGIWFGDCGRHENGLVILNTHIWKEKGSKLIVEYFDKLDWKAEVFTERKNYRVRLDEESSEDFLKICMPQMPHFFLNQATPFRSASQDQSPEPPSLE